LAVRLSRKQNLVNSTKGIIEKVVFHPSERDSYNQTCSIIPGGSYTTTVAKTESYDIVLIDTKGHHYGKLGCRWISDSETLSITDKNFVSQEV
jgi:hypothetical protein